MILKDLALNNYNSDSNSITGLIRSLLFAHLLLLSFQFLIRSSFIDSTFIRDIFIFSILVYSFMISAINYGFTIKRLSLLDKLIVYYLLYGIFLTVIWISTGIDIMSAVRVFRNHFFPFILFFAAKKAFSNLKSRMKLANLFYFIFLFIVIEILFEYFFITILGFSRNSLFWYRYSFEMTPYFYGNVVSPESAFMDPNISPILGLFGWPHTTVLPLVGLFMFNLPFLTKKLDYPQSKISSLWVYNLPTWFSYLLIMITAIIIFVILSVRMQMVIFILMMLYHLMFKKQIKPLIIISILMTITLYSNQSIFDLVTQRLVGAFVAGYGYDYTDTYKASIQQISTFQTLLSVNPITAIFSQPIFELLFGKWGASGGSELRLLNFTLEYGLVWLLLIISILLVSIYYKTKIFRRRSKNTIDYFIAVGIIYLFVSNFIDMGHYARMLYAPNIDIVAICLGTLSAIAIDQRALVHRDSINKNTP